MPIVKTAVVVAGVVCLLSSGSFAGERTTQYTCWNDRGVRTCTYSTYTWQPPQKRTETYFGDPDHNIRARTDNFCGAGYRLTPDGCDPAK
jgi:hypothetical protein